MRQSRPRISPSEGLPNPTYYVKALKGEFAPWCFDEDVAPRYCGAWREKVYSAEPDQGFDLEIGTGNGYHFAHYAKSHPERLFMGIELKFKPLIQSIRRAVNEGAKNARIIRYDAAFIQNLFAENELNNVLIHFPDPWPKKKQKKHRLIQPQFLDNLFRLQRENSWVEFKTDNRDYFDEALEKMKASPYTIERLTFDLHNSEYAEENYKTHFEKIFLKQGLPIHMCRLRKLTTSVN